MKRIEDIKNRRSTTANRASFTASGIKTTPACGAFYRLANPYMPDNKPFTTPPPTPMPDNKALMRFFHWTCIGRDYPLAFGILFSKGISGSNLPVDDF